MAQTENFVQDSALIILLTLGAGAIFTSSIPYICILLCGVIMLILSIRSFIDRPHSLKLMLLQLIADLAFVCASGQCLAFIALYSCRINKRMQIILPTAAYLIFALAEGNTELPVILFNCLELLIYVLVIALAERIIISYLTAKDHLARTVSITAVNEMYEKKLNQELLVKNYFADKNARLEERENISRNIHNSVGHSITAAIMTLDAADLLFDSSPEKAREKVNAANQRIRGSLEAIRRAVRVLDTENTYISVSDLISELKAVAESFVMDTSIRTRTDFTGVKADQSIPNEHTEFLMGALQELLTNGVRHGDADVFTISLNSDSNHIRLIVADNGNSAFSSYSLQEKIRNGFGLKKLVSYAEKCGGSAIFDDENGFRSVITLPLYKEE